MLFYFVFLSIRVVKDSTTPKHNNNVERSCICIRVVKDSTTPKLDGIEMINLESIRVVKDSTTPKPWINSI